MGKVLRARGEHFKVTNKCIKYQLHIIQFVLIAALNLPASTHGVCATFSALELRKRFGGELGGPLSDWMTDWLTTGRRTLCKPDYNVSNPLCAVRLLGTKSAPLPHDFLGVTERISQLSRQLWPRQVLLARQS